METSEFSWLSQLLKSLEEADIYLRLSFVGLIVLFVLCCFICCAWSRYGSVIASVFNQKKAVANEDDLRSPGSQLGPVGNEWTMARSSSDYISWQQQGFPLTPETRKLDKAIKKRQ